MSNTKVGQFTCMWCLDRGNHALNGHQCDEQELFERIESQARDIAELESQLAEARNLRHRLFSGFSGCTDGGCVISDNRKGMHTNGGCTCFLNMSRSQLNIVQNRLQAILYSTERSE